MAQPEVDRPSCNGPVGDVTGMHRHWGCAKEAPTPSGRSGKGSPRQFGSQQVPLLPPLPCDLLFHFPPQLSLLQPQQPPVPQTRLAPASGPLHRLTPASGPLHRLAPASGPLHRLAPARMCSSQLAPSVQQVVTPRSAPTQLSATLSSLLFPSQPLVLSVIFV